MASSQLINVGIGLGVLSLLLLVAVLLGAHKSKSRYSTPGIASKEDGVLTSSISMLLQANADEVFDVILNFEDYSWASNTRYAWNDENPGVGSTGTITLDVEDFMTKAIKITMTHLDRKTRTLVECTTEYPRWLLNSRIALQVVPIEGRKNQCQLKYSLTHDGIAAYYLLLVAKAELADTQRRFAEDLKAFVERSKR